MIIEKVTVNIFGGLARKEVNFTDGVNVVLGPNESGKSTIYHAIEHTLFTPSNLTPAKFRKQMGRFIPVEGGDTIKVTVQFKNQGSEYTLQRRWGASVSASLTLPGGSIITDDDAIQKILKECLRVPEGTCKTIMMTYQTGLSRTVRDIQKDKETLKSLGDVLRKTVMEMDGMSVDAFKDKIEDSYENFFGRWDAVAHYPKGNRGIENPWVKGAGSITTLFYEKERQRKALGDAVRYEKELDYLNRTLSDHADNVGEIDSYVKRNKALKDDALRRRQLEADLKGLDLEYEKLGKINKDWPVTEAKAEEISKKIPELEAKIARVNKEKEEAESYQRGKELLDRYARVEKKKQGLDTATENLKNVSSLTDEDLKRMREAYSRRSRLETSLSAGKLSAKFTPRKDTELGVQTGLEDTSRTEIRAEETFDFQAGGRLLLSHPEWDLEVTSGEVEYDRIAAECAETKLDIEQLLRKFKVKSFEEAEALNLTYKGELAKVENAKSTLQEELGDFSYEDLEKTAKDLQLKKPDRALEMILAEEADTKVRMKSLKQEFAELQEKLRTYAAQFGDQQALLEKLAEVAGARSEKQRSLNVLKPLPEEVGSVDEFIREYEEMESRLGVLRDEHNKLIQERIRLEAKAADRSVEEIERDLAEAEERFDAELRKGLAIARIKENMDTLLEELDSTTYKGLEKDVSRLMEKMTGGRYEDVLMEESIPSGFQRNDGIVMPYDNLSTGTRDTLGIALRLAITKSFLEDKEGFVIMDDPLVELDPGRQSKAAQAIREFAKDKQLIVLTCHPPHAELLGGNRIELNRR